MFDLLIHKLWFELLIVVVAGLLTGLEIKEYRVHNEAIKEIGSVRTFTFISLIGFIFFKIDFYLYMLGYAALVGHFLLFYVEKLKTAKNGMLLFLMATLVYSFGVLITKFDIWFLTVVFISIIFIYNINRRFGHIYTMFDEEEIEIFSKLLLLSAVILPLLPQENISEMIPVSYFKVWLAVVVVSMFSYTGYVLKRYIFKDKGYLIAGILGGIYSSTATTIVLAKKSTSGRTPHIFAASIIMATAFMYIRLLGITYAFNHEIALKLIIPFVALTLISTILAYLMYRRAEVQVNKETDESEDKNPLELTTAFLFAILFIAMSVITHFVTINYGDIGLNILSFIVGFTDIDPFILSILSSKLNISVTGASSAIIIAAGSNNILKAFYAYIFSKNVAGKMSALALLALGILTMGIAFLNYV
jgi:uncharacterized membrane protein (DUF4010 family)